MYAWISWTYLAIFAEPSIHYQKKIYIIRFRFPAENQLKQSEEKPQLVHLNGYFFQIFTERGVNNGKMAFIAI